MMNTVLDDVSKMKRFRRLKVYGYLGSGLLMLFGGKIAYSKGEGVDIKHARLEQDHKALVKVVEQLSKKVDAGEAKTNKVERKVDRLEVMMEIELDLHGVPKSKRPPKVEDDETP